MIYFRNIEIEGFGSFITNTRFTLERPGINVINGSVGSGKTTILSALYWALFQQLLKEKSSVNTWEWLQPDDYKGTKVSVDFHKDGHEYNLTRCQSYTEKIHGTKGKNNIYLTKEGKLIDLGKGKREEQRALEEFLEYSPDLFKNAVIFGQKLKRIIEETGPKKKQIMEEAFSMDYILRAAALTKEQYSKELDQYNTLVNSIDSGNSKIKMLKNTLSVQKELEKNFNDNQSKNIDRIEKNIAKVSDKLGKIKKKVDNITTEDPGNIEKLISSLESELRRNQNEKKSLESKLKILSVKEKSLKVNVCSECNSKLNTKTIKVQKKKFKDERKALESELKENNRFNVEDMETAIKNHRENLQLAKGFKKDCKKLKKLKSEINQLNEELNNERSQTIEVKSTGIRKQVKELKKDIRTKKLNLRKLEKSKEVTEWLIKDPLSNSGIKTYLLQELLSRINSILYEYSDILGFVTTFEIDMETSAKDFRQLIHKNDGQMIDYYDLSGGQKQLVDTSVALAIHDAVSEIKPNNLLFMDEPFESLDQDTVDIVSELIHMKPKDKAVFIITHQTSFKPRNADIINISLDGNGNSVIS